MCQVGHGEVCTPLANPDTAITIPERAGALLGRPLAFRLTGEELLGCGLWPGDILIVDAADREPEPGALIVVWGTEPDPEPRELPPSMAGLSPALLAKFRPVREVPIVGQHWPCPNSHHERGGWSELRAVLPGFPAPLRILDYAFADALIGVVHGFYGTGAREHTEGIDVFTDADDWEGWDFRAEIARVRGTMRALEAMLGRD